MTSDIVLAAPLQSIGSWQLWAISIAALLTLLTLDFVLTHRPHEVSMPEAVGWSVFYLLLPVAFGLYLLADYGGTIATEFFTGFVVEKSLSVDNLFVFILLLPAFGVPKALEQRVLLFGIVGALVLRGIFIALGAVALQSGTWAFLLFGAILLVTAVKTFKDATSGRHAGDRTESSEADVSEMRSIRFIRRALPVTPDYRGTSLLARHEGRLALTPLAAVIVAVFATDVVFAVDSVPAVYGITSDPYLVFSTNAFALLGLRALYFVLQGVLNKLVHLHHGLAIILGFIGVKLVLHWAHETWEQVPAVPTWLSLTVIVLVLTVVTLTSLRARARN
ncbi:TerC/Alx family metal homeostasis membrane protein [Amycolatopsis cihanbeyliensis]|uniref:TerC family integral membrane protein n=1 Tax=Amycolatopsis cihanbeyliensis TaxID=1128664 RepID=A0A542DHD4_AMYCI|nr:TerC/Alx family metal homeostasis membrane protein [Amycolatopsis cihanbeyliensis]TQJ02450.1 TerC family integral membrane protein [Amycolatopsis cihanbeyliensis]